MCVDWCSNLSESDVSIFAGAATAFLPFAAAGAAAAGFLATTFAPLSLSSEDSSLLLGAKG